MKNQFEKKFKSNWHCIVGKLHFSEWEGNCRPYFESHNEFIYLLQDVTSAPS